MIQYETDRSPFFVANKNYCDTIENNLKAMDIDCHGFCSSYGYEVEVTFQRQDLTYHLRFHKHQSTQNGVVIPADAINYAGIEGRVSGLNKKIKVVVGKSPLRRFLTSRAMQAKIPAPYFIVLNPVSEKTSLDDLVKKILDNKISIFKLKKGELAFKMHGSAINPSNLILAIESMVKNWA